MIHALRQDLADCLCILAAIIGVLACALAGW